VHKTPPSCSGYVTQCILFTVYNKLNVAHTGDFNHANDVDYNYLFLHKNNITIISSTICEQLLQRRQSKLINETIAGNSGKISLIMHWWTLQLLWNSLHSVVINTSRTKMPYKWGSHVYNNSFSNVWWSIYLYHMHIHIVQMHLAWNRCTLLLFFKKSLKSTVIFRTVVIFIYEI